MSKLLKYALLMLFAASTLTGCAAKDLFSMKQTPKEPANGETQLERDPVPAGMKDEQGIHYDPREWTGAVYNPDQVGRMITGSGVRGVQQMSFAGTGGDMQVCIDKTGEYMVYSSKRYSSTPKICKQKIDSRAVMQITTDKMSDMMPSFSHDSKRIAWCSDRYGQWDILVQSTDSSSDSDAVQLTRSTDDEVHPTWSADDRLLAYSRFNSMDGSWQIWVKDLNTDATSSIGDGLFPEFRPIEELKDGRKVYTMVYQKHRQRDIPWFSIWMSTITVEKNGQISSVAPPIEIVADDRWAAITPCWSPDGEYIAFATVGKGTLAQWQARIYKPDDIYVVRMDGTDLTQITRHAAPDWNPYWAVDPNNPNDANGRIYFTSNRSGVPNIWSVRPVIAGMVARR